MSEMKQRDYFFDTMKAILIFLVVFAHVLQAFGKTEVTDILYKLIFSFHMPAFLFVTGYFARYHPKAVFGRMLPLYVVFMAVNYALTYGGALIQTGHFPNDNIYFFTPRYTLWYLLAVMAYQLFLPLVTTESKKQRRIFMLIAIVLGLLMGLEKNTNNLLALSRIFTFFPFFLWGYYERDSGCLIQAIRKNQTLFRIVTAIIGVGMVIGMCFLHNSINRTWFFGTLSYRGDTGFTWYIRIICYVIAMLWIILLMTWTPRREIPWLAKIGKNTLSVYLLHAPLLLILKALPQLQVFKGNLIFILIVSVLMTVLLSREPIERLIRKIKVDIK